MIDYPVENKEIMMMIDACLSDIQRTKDSGRREGINVARRHGNERPADRTSSTAAAELDAGR